MPLLRKKAFERQSVPDYLRDDEEVFYCEITNEIFRDYHEFSERMFLCNSMVWTCSMTGKSNLTYREAVESEEHAKQCLKDFPSELKTPILYLATLTKRTYFGEMADDIFYYIRDRYFIGEHVEASFTMNKWKDSHILSVIAPGENTYKKEIKHNGSNSPSDRNFIPSANLYKYEIEHLDSEDTDISEIMIVDSTQLRRKKTLFSRDKCKLFLKQYVEQDSCGIYIINSSAMAKFSLKTVKWETIFNGPLPNFQSSKNFEKAVTGKKKQKQETLSKYLEKNGFLNKKDGENKAGKGSSLIERMQQKTEEFNKLKQLNEEQRAAEKQRKKKEQNRMKQCLREWSRQKEDLELEDHKELPKFLPVKTKCEKYFGEILSILEFVQTFHIPLSTRDFFPNGFTLDVIERALTEKEVAGPLTDLIQMLLIAIFNCQDEESKNYNTVTLDLKDINEETLSTNLSLNEVTHLATLASRWAINHQGQPLSRLPLYPLTVSEILRLHLLSSGARIKDHGSKWRYAQRGGYTNEDDPGLRLRLNQSHILKALSVHNVVQLSISDKLKILDCLINQLLTYVDIRDLVEEKIEKARVARIDLRAARAIERKRELEYIAHKVKLKKELTKDHANLEKALSKLNDENEMKQVDNRMKIEQLLRTSNEGLTILGLDRAYRRYIKIESIPGLFINWEHVNAGTCLAKITAQYPELYNADRTELLTHLKQINNISENLTQESQKSNGSNNVLVSSDPNMCKNLLLCTADMNDCPVHTEHCQVPKWFFIHDKELLDELIECLNKRGIREGELKDNIVFEKDHLVKLISKTPVMLLNDELTNCESDDKSRPNGSTKKKDRYEDANLGYPADMKSEEVLENALIENVLEMEEKVTAGALGVLRVKDRENWRTCIQNKNYIEFETLPLMVVDKENKNLNVKKADKGSRSGTPEITEKKEDKEYQDPGKFLGPDASATLDTTEENEDTALEQTSVVAIRCLAQALCQVAQAVDSKHLKKPLGHADVRSTTKTKEKYDILDRWEQSLLASTSFSQVFLHYVTLDSCVMWSRSALLARCRICRRRKDSENMLLCDCCNLGHHMYCLKPKLTTVPQGDWFCDKCTKEKEKEEQQANPEPEKKRRKIFIEEEAEEEEEQDSGNVEDADEDVSSDNEIDEKDESSAIKIDLCKTCRSGGEIVSCDKCQSNFHKECVEPPLRRLPRAPWTCPPCMAKNKNERNQKNKSLENGDNSDSDTEVINRRSMRREDGREDLPLHNVALQELLCDVMKHEDSWPFIRPVQQKEVPDYYEIISNPMDFGTIKYKLNVGDYTTDSQLLRDVVLVFENCNTYNSSDDEVYKCGVRLLKYLAKRAKQIGLKVPPELETDDTDEPKPKKKRTK